MELKYYKRKTKLRSVYRAIPTGAKERIERGSLGYSSNIAGGMEERYGISFITHELSDAIAVMRDRFASSDWCLSVFSSNYFNAELAAGRAAFLAFAEAGHVFRYPFLVGELLLQSADHILTAEKVESADLETYCHNLGLRQQAEVLPATRFPGEHGL